MSKSKIPANKLKMRWISAAKKVPIYKMPHKLGNLLKVAGYTEGIGNILLHPALNSKYLPGTLAHEYFHAVPYQLYGKVFGEYEPVDIINYYPSLNW